MDVYLAPTREIAFALKEVAGLDEVLKLPGLEEVSDDLVEAILEEAGKFATSVLAPLNRVGDEHGARLVDGRVVTAPGWPEAYRQYREAGWAGLSAPLEYGGQGLPKVLGAAVNEMWKAANHAFALCPMLTHGAIEALLIAGSDALKATYLPKLIGGEWTGTMNLTEPQAGSDLSLIRSKAVPAADGTYRISGQKIFITYGDHDLTDNIVHLVLARLPDAPAGVKGISLFLVPHRLPKADGTPGELNDVKCASLEHKLGIHGSPTCTMVFGEASEGALGYLVGEPNRGLETMFIMMNEARFAVGQEGIGDAERAYQGARAYAQDRLQGRSHDGTPGTAPILRHPDVRRMLMSIRATTEAARCLSYTVAAWMDRADRSADADQAARFQRWVDLLIPVVKGWSTEMGVESASLGMQVHGGMGYVEEAGAAQHLRDVRITTIYEGTTGIQALDLIGRKVSRDGGAAVRELMGVMAETAAALSASPRPELQRIGARLDAGLAALGRAVAGIVAEDKASPRLLAGAVPFLHLMGLVCGGWQLGKGALAAARGLVAGDGDQRFLMARINSAVFFADQRLVHAPAYAETLLSDQGVLLLGDDDY